MKIRRKWKRMDDEELKRFHYMGLTNREVAKLISASQSGVSRALQRLGIAPNYPHENEDRSPEEIYKESKDRALNWKNRNIKRVKEMFAEWQKDNRKKRNIYQAKWEKRKNANIRT